MFSMNSFCFSCLKNKNNLCNVKNSINGVSFEEKLIYAGLFYDLPANTEELLCQDCCEQINKVYDFKKQFLEKQELLRTYIQSLKLQKHTKKFKNLSQNVTIHQYLPETKVLNVDLTDEDHKNDQIFDLTLDDDEIIEEKFNTVDFTLTNPFTSTETNEIVNEHVETNELLEVIVKTKEEPIENEENEEKEENTEREFINNLPEIEQNYQIEQENNNGLKIVFKKSEKDKYECIFCMKIFYNEKNLKLHEKIHPKNNIPCKICKKVLKHKLSFQVHMSQHTGDYKYLCTICNRGLSSKQNLKIHKLSHLKKKNKKNGDEVSKKRYPSRSSDSTETIDSQLSTSTVNMPVELSKRYPSRPNSEIDLPVSNVKVSNDEVSTVNLEPPVKRKVGRPRKNPINILSKPDNFCKKCNYKFVNKHCLIKHNFRFHTEHTCVNCNKKFGSKLELSKHRRICQVDTKNIYCEKCDLYFSNFANYDNHVDRAHKEHKCQKCDLTFQNKMMLIHHKKRVCQMSNFKCEFCDMSFKLSIQLQDHLKCHVDDFSVDFPDVNNENVEDPNSDYKCEVCDRIFMNKLKLDTHMLIHSGVFNFQCKYCPNMFTTDDQLETHITRMHKTKFYHCKSCVKSFKTYVNYKRHVQRIHLNLGPKFHCEFCTKTFNTFRQLRNHKMTHSSNEKVFQCTECDKMFFNKTNLIRHLITHTQERNHICKYCGRKFNLGAILIRHIKAFHVDDEEFEQNIQ